MRRAGIVALVAAAAFVLYRFPPGCANFYPACPLHAITGWNCALCGTTRALSAALHGRWQQAWMANPALPLFLLAGLAAWTWRRRLVAYRALATSGAAALLVLWSVFRNLCHR